LFLKAADVKVDVKKKLGLLAILLCALAVAHGQVAPAATGPGTLPLSGTLHYSVRYSQMAAFRGSEGDQQSGTVSGDATYANISTRYPFTLAYGGGYDFSIAGAAYGNGLFQHLTLSQGIVGRRWSATLSDNVSLTPQSPDGGFSGVAGTGDLTGSSGTGTSPSSTVLTVNTRMLNNSTTGNFQRRINYALSFNAGGSYQILRYLDGNGIDTTTEMGDAGLSWRLDARNSLTSQYSYSHYTDPGIGLTFESNTATVGFQRKWTRHLSSIASAGPQWTNTSDSAVVPSSTRLSVSASANYQFRTSNAGLSYTRGSAGSTGVTPGGQTESLSANYSYSRKIGRDVNLGLVATYMHMTTADQLIDLTTDSGTVSAQATRRLGRYANIFASYSAMDQSSNNALPSNALNQLNQTISFGIGYSPRETHLRP
jgi:hypothetical protein